MAGRLSMQERSATTQAHMENALRLADRIRASSRRSVELEKLIAELNFLQDRLRSLENKAMEVEKMEITMDSLRKNIENSQQEVRDTERALRTVRKQLEARECNIQDLEKQIAGYEFHNKDLKLQVREELVRNVELEEKLEHFEGRDITKLEDVEVYRAKCREQEHVITELRKESHEKDLIAQHARKCLREEKDKSKTTLHHCSFKARTEMAETEIDTLKRLLGAKDKYLIQKSQTLENAKNYLRSWELSGVSKDNLLAILSEHKSSTNPTNTNGNKATANKGTANKGTANKQTKIGQENGHSTHSNHAAVNGHTRDTSAHHSSSRRERAKTPDLLRTLLDVDDHVSDVSEISMKQSQKSPQSYNGSFANFRHGSDSASMNSTTLSFGSENNVGRDRIKSPRVRRAQSAREAANSTPILEKRGRWAHSTQHTNRNRTEKTKPNPDEMSPEDLEDYEERLSKCIEIDSKVIVNLSRKTDKRLFFAPARVMFVGAITGARESNRIYLGIELDDAMGNTDGVFKGKRYFRALPRHGKFVLITCLISVLDKQTGKFLKVESLLEDSEEEKHTLPQSRAQPRQADLIL